MKVAVARSFITVLSLAGSSCQHQETVAAPPAAQVDSIRVDPQVLAAHKLDWTAKSSYVAIKLPYGPIAALKKDVETREQVALQSRGEAHITVITPPEMSTLRTRLSLEQINGFIAKSNIQSIPFELQCLGRLRLKQDQRQLATYFVLVKSPGIFQLREKLRQEFVAAGGDKKAFTVEELRPHITVGFTERDLHLEDGVIKDARSCFQRLE